MAARLSASQLLFVLPGPPRRRGQDGFAGWAYRACALQALPQAGATRGCGEVLGDLSCQVESVQSCFQGIVKVQFLDALLQVSEMRVYWFLCGHGAANWIANLPAAFLDRKTRFGFHRQCSLVARASPTSRQSKNAESVTLCPPKRRQVYRRWTEASRRSERAGESEKKII